MTLVRERRAIQQLYDALPNGYNRDKKRPENPLAGCCNGACIVVLKCHHDQCNAIVPQYFELHETNPTAAIMIIYFAEHPSLSSNSRMLCMYTIFTLNGRPEEDSVRLCNLTALRCDEACTSAIFTVAFSRHCDSRPPDGTNCHAIQQPKCCDKACSCNCLKEKKI